MFSRRKFLRTAAVATAATGSAAGLPLHAAAKPMRPRATLAGASSCKTLPNSL